MFDIGWIEMLVVAIITVLFVGPRELPGMLRTFGAVMRKLKSLASEFQAQFSQALKETEIDELKKIMNNPVSIEPSDKTIKPKDEKTPEEIEAEIARDYEKAREMAVSNKKQSGKNAVPGFTSDTTDSDADSKTESKAS